MKIKKIFELIRWPFYFDNFWVGVSSLFYKFSKSGLKKIKLKNGLTIFTSGTVGDLDIFREVFVQSYFDKKYIDFSSISTALDIGANIGLVTLKMLKTNPNMKVVCLEPDLNNFNFLLKNIENNSFSNSVIALNKALWKSNGYVTLYKTKGYHQGNSIYSEHLPSIEKRSSKTPSIEINTVIKKFKLENIDLIKLDVEGAEYEILFNLKPDLIRSVKYFHIECHRTSQHKPKDMVDFMSSNNFELYFPYEGENQFIAVNKNIDIKAQ